MEYHCPGRPTHQIRQRNPDVIPSDVTLYILPDMNPDGDARSHDEWGRVNANGVDLNRNFPIGWGQPGIAAAVMI